MFIDNKIANDIKECKSIPNLVRYLSVNRNMILAFQSDIFATIDNINKYQDGAVTDIDKSYFDFFYYNKKEVTKLDYDFLNLYSNNILKYLMDIKDNMCCASLFLLLLDRNNIMLFEEKLKELPGDKYEVILKNFYQRLIDLYVPCENPEVVINQIWKIGSLGNIFKMSYDSDKFLNSICEKDRTIDYSRESVILFKWISDIYSNDETKFNTFKKLHYMETKSIVLQDKIDEVEKRYSKYFKDYTKDLIYELLTIFNEDDIENPLFVLLNRTKNGFPNTNVKIIESFLKDILEISFDFIDSFHYDRSLTIVNSLCNNGVFESLVTKDMPAIETLVFNNEMGIVTEAYSKGSNKYHDVQNKIYKSYKNYKKAEDKVDSQVTKAVVGMKNVLIGDVKSEIIEGKKFSAISLLKKILGTAAIFSFGPVKGAITLLIRYALKKNTTLSERKKIIMELEAELEMINEKIDDAKGDNNRQAKYAMMRTRTELANALKRIKYGLEADERSVGKAKATINTIRSKF